MSARTGAEARRATLMGADPTNPDTTNSDGMSPDGMSPDLTFSGRISPEKVNDAAMDRADMGPDDLVELLGVPLSDEQLAVATAPLGPQLVVAGAGSGKTTVMAARATWLVGTGQLRPSQVLGLTFTNKAAAELRARLIRAVDRLGGEPAGTGWQDEVPTVITYDAFAGQVLAEFGLLLGLEPAGLVDEGERRRVAHAVACQPSSAAQDAQDALRTNPTMLAARLLELDGNLANLDVSTDQVRVFDSEFAAVQSQGECRSSTRALDAALHRRSLSLFVDQFRAEKGRRNIVDFADRTRLVSALAQLHRGVGAQLRRRYGAVLLDEYQDTSRAQRITMQSLFGDGHPVTAVGDPCQAIYGWRGASVTNIDRFADHFPRSDDRAALVQTLTVNRRSDARIVGLANRVADDLHAVHSDVRPLRHRPEAGNGRLGCSLHESYDDELQGIADSIQDQFTQGWQPHDVVVLCRTNEQVRDIAQTLGERDVEHQVAAKANLLALDDVAAVAGLLELLVDPEANPAVVAHLTGPQFRVGPRDLAALGRRARHLTASGPDDAETCLLDAVRDPGPEVSDDAAGRCRQFSDLLDRLGRLGSRPTGEVVREAMTELGHPARWAANPQDVGSSGALREFADLADREGAGGLADFVSYVRDCRRFGTEPTTPEMLGGPGVKIMTMHGAKGLEFPVVILPFLSQKVFPSATASPRWPTGPTTVPDPLIRKGDHARTGWSETLLHDERRADRIGEDAAFPEGVRPDRAVDVDAVPDLLSAPFTTAMSRAFGAAARVGERHDEDRLAYVAITRAQHVLVASGHWWGPTQSGRRGPSDYLLKVRDACGPEEIRTWHPAPARDATSPVLDSAAAAVQWPDPDPRSSARQVWEEVEATSPLPPVPSTTTSPSASGPDSWDARVDDLITGLRGVRSDRGTGAGLLSVTDVMAAAADPEGHWIRRARPMPQPPSAAAQLGVQFHRWLAAELSSPALIPDEELRPEGVDPVLAGWQHAFRESEFSGRRPVAVEHSFTVSIEGVVLTGQIDAVFAAQPDAVTGTAGPNSRRGRNRPDPNRGPSFELIDWKTGRAEPDPLQLAVYRHAWARVRGVDPETIRCGFFHVPTGRTRWVDDLPDLAAALAQLAPDPADGAS